MKSPEFYIYFWLRKDGTPYYIGKGKSRRAYAKRDALNKPTCDSRIKIFSKDLTEQQAFALERFWVKVFGRQDLNTGILRNRTDGGEGVTGSFRTIETKEKMSKWQRGRKLTELHKKNIQKITDSGVIDKIMKLSGENLVPPKIKEILNLSVTVRTIYNIIKREST